MFFLFIFYDNIKLNIYKININNEVEISLIKTIGYNKNNKIILKKNSFIIKKKILFMGIYLFIYWNNSFFILIY